MRIAESGRLKYNWANISSFCFTTEFIKRAKDHLEQTGQFHIARKKIPSVLGPVQVCLIFVHEMIWSPATVMATALQRAM